MALKTGEPKSAILEQLRNQIATAKSSANTIKSLTGSNLEVVILVSALQTLFNARELLRSHSADRTPGELRQWARDQYDDPTYDIVTGLATLDTAMTDVINWINANVPKDAQGYYGEQRINVTTGVMENQEMTPAQLAPLNPLLNAVIAA